MWKKIFSLILILSLLVTLIGCGVVPAIPPTPDSELVLVQVTDTKSNLISVAGKENEDAMAILGEKDIEGNPTNITGAVYVFEQGDSFGIDAGIDGLPTYLIDSEGNKIIFENYTNSTVDISIYDSNGDLIQGPTTINVDSADLLELKQLYNSFYSQQKGWEEYVANGLRWGAIALPWIGCAVSVGGTVVFLPLIVLTAKACASPIAKEILVAIANDDEFTQVATVVSGTVACSTLDPYGCSSLLLKIVADEIDNHAPIISSLTANPSSINISETTTITCTASDEDISDFNTLTYTWTKTDGTFEGSTTGATVTWRAPSTQGNYTVSCEVSDGKENDSESVNISVGDVNYAPDITSTAITSATKGQPYSYNVDAIDSDGDTLTYSLTTKPSGMTINSLTGLITWTPTTSGNYNVTVKVSDGELSDTQSFTVTVEENGTSLVPPTGLSVSSSWNTTPPGFPSMALSWNAVSGATGYDMWVRPSGGSSVSLGTRDAPYVTFNSNSLPGGARYVSGTTYYFKVRTVTASGTSAFTSEVPCMAAAAPSPSLGKVQLSSPGNGVTLPPMNVTFIWNPVSNATKYEFILYNQQGQVALDTTYSSTSATVALGTEETITWKVRAGDNSGNWGPWSDKWSLTLKSTTTIKSDLIVSNIWTEPNPPIAAGYTTIGIEIKNQGNADATGTFFLEFYFDVTYQGHVYINGLTVGSTNTSYWQAVTWPSDINLHTIKGVVDPDNIVVESNENNNQYSIQVKATEPPIGIGTLKIESVPGSAKVYIDGGYKGETPSSGYLTISNLTAGDHDLKVTKSGYKDWIGVVTIPSGSTQYKAVILESITIKPDPPTPLSPGTTSAPGPTIDTLTPILKWQTVSNADYYALAISVYPYGSTNIVYNPQEVYGSSIAIPSGKLEAGKKYRWNMQSHNSAGWSEEVSILLYFQTEPSPTSQIERLTNASFSSGTNGWTLVGDFWAGTNLSNYHTSPGYAAGGVNSAGSPKNNAVGWMYQDVSITSGATSATLSFWYNITSEEAGSTAYDILNVTIHNSTGNYLATVAVLSNLNKSSLGSYNKVTFDVTSYKGQTIRVHFLATTDGSVYTVFRIDDVSLMSDG